MEMVSMRKRIAALRCALGCVLGTAPLLPLPARADFVGPSMLPVDEYTRREFLVPGQIDSQYAALDPVVRSMLQAFTKGINDAGVPTWANPQTHPALYDILGVPSPALNPWTPQQCLQMLMLFSTD